jgi:esterase/lipase superfamily enzyme
MIEALGSLIAEGRIKIYSLDSIAGSAWLSDNQSPLHCAWLQNQFDAAIYHEVVPAIRMDCRDPSIDIVAAGASLGAFNSVASICRHPDVFAGAIAMSGTYDISDWLQGDWSDDFYYSSPIHYLPDLGEGEQLHRLRQRYIVLPTGQGRWEDPQQSWRMAEILGSKGIPNRVDPWGTEWDHDWPTWRVMLPQYLAELA